MALIQFQNQDKFFIKFFLLDSSLNLNKWGVTEKSLHNNLESFVGKPFVLTPDYGHPDALSGDDLFVKQEKYRVGDIIQVGFDDTTGKAYGVAEIYDKKAIRIIKDGLVNFVSPSIVFTGMDEVRQGDSSVIVNWEGAHVAAVAEPAYGVTKAEIKGKCVGDKNTCSLQLERVQASVSPCGKYLTLRKNGKSMTIANRKCVEACIQKKADKGVEIDDQALAICYSECYDNKEGNIDPQSLENITKVDLPKKKKKKNEGDHTEVTMPRKRKGPVKSNAKKAKNKKEEEDEDYEVQMQSFTKKGHHTGKPHKHTSVKSTQSKKGNNMKHSYANEDEEKREKDSEEEEENKKEGQENTFEEQYQEKKETDIIEGEEEEKEKDAEEDETPEDDRVKRGEDPDKLDLTDRQEEYLKDKKDSSLRKQVKTLKAELRAIKAQMRKAKLDPIIDTILDAKSQLGKINAKAEYAKLSRLDAETLRELANSYKSIQEAKASPRYTVKYASVDSSVKGDEILKRIRGEMN